MDSKKIQNIDTYDPKAVRTEVLKDDFRIALAWLSLIDSGKKFKYPREKVIHILKGITSELIRRGIQFHPDKMKLNVRKNFYAIIRSLEPKVIEHPRVDDIEHAQLLVTKKPLAPSKTGFYILTEKGKAFAAVRIRSESIPRPSSTFDKYIDKTNLTMKEFKDFFDGQRIIYLTKFDFIFPLNGVKLKYDGDVLKYEKSDDILAEIEAFLFGFDVEDETKGFVQKLLPVAPNHKEKEQSPIRIEDVLKFLNDDFVIRDEMVALTGSIVYDGTTKHDIDFFIKASEDEKIYIPIMFRLYRALPPEIRDRTQFIPNKFEGPFSDYIPLYDLACWRRENNVVIENSDSLKIATRAKDPKVAAMAKDSLREDRIEPGRFFLPLKTSVNSINAYREGEVYNADALIEYLKKIGKGEIPEVAIQKKYD